MIRKTLGGDRLGSGKKMSVDLHGYERSNHDLSYKWRSSISPGTLVPFMCKVALPGDTWDINLNSEILTHPTLGPLFGEFKAQFDIFECPIRLYHGALHNNKLNIGLKMSDIALPQMLLYGINGQPNPNKIDYAQAQVNPSSILSYLGINGIAGNNSEGAYGRYFNAIPLIAYWDIFKNYYSNKMEDNAYVVHTPPQIEDASITNIQISCLQPDGTFTGIAVGSQPINIRGAWQVNITQTVPPYDWQLIFETSQGDLNAEQVGVFPFETSGGVWNYAFTGDITVTNWRLLGVGETTKIPPKLTAFPLKALDDFRETLLIDTIQGMPSYTDIYNVSSSLPIEDAENPYNLLLGPDYGLQPPYCYTQEGLAVKTYQSDLFNNWINLEMIDATGGINDITKIVTSSGSFTLDTFLLNKKIYDFLNRIVVSGGTYKDWIDVTYDQNYYVQAITPVYHGGMSKEVIFQEVISMSQSAASQSGQPNQPLGTLAGRGKTAHQKGGKVTIRVSEPSYIIGIISLTPRLDYSMGNTWDTHLQTMDDLHKPALDQIGFQDLMQEQFAWYTTYVDGPNVIQQAAGKQPAWINYMTSVNETHGNFAMPSNEMFMTLNRRYGVTQTGNVFTVTDMTTYIDPSKFNFIFAQTSLDAMNFWAQIAVNINVRRKMSAKLMPNL